jgi:hypothetical protein
MPHRTHSVLKQEIAKAKELVQIGSQYIHYRYPKKRYHVLDIGIQEESEKVCIIYCDTNMPDIHFVRDLDSWLEQVEYNGSQIDRFIPA